MKEELLYEIKTFKGGVKKYVLTKGLLGLPENEGVTLEAGTYNECSVICPPADEHGYYKCVGGQCVYFPY